MVAISELFPRYTQFDPMVRVWCVTPGVGRCIHRYFDTSPFSPSGRYLALTRFPREDCLPAPGDIAEVLLIDLFSGEEHLLTETRGWDTQLGAQVQWGATDKDLFFNDVDTESWLPFGVRLDPFTGARNRLDGPVYMVSPNGRAVAGPCLRRTGRTQAGYGVIVPPETVPLNWGAPDDDGIYLTDTETGKSRLLVTFRDIAGRASPPIDTRQEADGGYYGFHVKWNRQGDRLMLVLRWQPLHGRRRPSVVTLNADGSNIRVAIPESEWAEKRGHHPNWCPDGRHVMMNLNIDREGMRFVSALYDGSEYAVLSKTLIGSGHPSMHPDEQHVLTDAYPGEPIAFGDGTVPIRLVNVLTGEEKQLARIHTLPTYTGPRKALRLDPHPAWDRSFRWIAFNACPDGTRRVYIADLSGHVKSGS